MALLITLLTGLFILLGCLVIRFVKDPVRVEQISVALAFGAMIAIAALDMIPEIIEAYSGRSFWIPVLFTALGLGILKLLDLFIPEHGHGGEHTHEAGHDHGGMAHIGAMSALAVVLHNVIEGMTVYNVAMSSTRSGLMLALGVGLHNIPMGMLIYSLLKEERPAVRYGALAAVTLSTLLGGVIMSLLRTELSEAVTAALLCIALGMLIYIVFFELLEHLLKSKKPLYSVLFSLLGFAVVYVSTLFE